MYAIRSYYVRATGQTDRENRHDSLPKPVSRTRLCPPYAVPFLTEPLSPDDSVVLNDSAELIPFRLVYRSALDFLTPDRWKGLNYKSMWRTGTTER